MKTRVEDFNELRKVHLQSESPFDSNDGCYAYDALMNIAGSLAVLADLSKEIHQDLSAIQITLAEKE